MVSRLKIISVTFILVIITAISIFAQPKFNDSKLAYQYYRNKDYDKAIIIYKSLYDNSNSSRSYFVYYLNCLLKLGELENAEGLIKKEIKNRPKDLTLQIELGHIYEQQGLIEKANKKYKKAIRNLPANNSQVIHLSNTFRGKRKYKLAKETLLKGRKLLKDNTLFRNNLASVYLVEREYDSMLNEYLYLLAEDKSSLKNIKQRLQSAMYIDVDDVVYNKIKDGVILQIQKNPSVVEFNELLIWLYVQKKEFRKAFYQAKAIDKRNNEEGGRMMQLARLSISNEDIEVATEIIKYVITKGSGSSYFFEAKETFLSLSYKRLLLENKTDETSMSSLETSYIETVNEFGENAKTAGIIIDMAHIQAFYLDKTIDAKNNLESLLKMTGLTADIRNRGKMLLADIFLFEGDIWEAALLYAQIEKANKENTTGHEAKLRKARLAYYAGDFMWAQAQLDVLKASTSKLIANDAFDLSTLITENTGLDTTETAMQMFAKADLLIYRKKDSLAVIVFDSILTEFPNHSLTDEVIFRKGEVAFSLSQYDLAIKYFKEVVDGFGYDILADNALFTLANIYAFNKNDEEEASKLYKKLITDYSNSIFVVEARKQYRKINGFSEEEVLEPKEINP